MRGPPESVLGLDLILRHRNRVVHSCAARFVRVFASYPFATARIATSCITRVSALGCRFCGLLWELVDISVRDAIVRSPVWSSLPTSLSPFSDSSTALSPSSPSSVCSLSDCCARGCQICRWCYRVRWLSVAHCCGGVVSVCVGTLGGGFIAVIRPRVRVRCGRSIVGGLSVTRWFRCCECAYSRAVRV